MTILDRDFCSEYGFNQFMVKFMVFHIFNGGSYDPSMDISVVPLVFSMGFLEPASRDGALTTCDGRDGAFSRDHQGEIKWKFL